MNPKLKKWLKWLAIIKGEVQDLMVAQHTFKELQAMISANPALHQPSSFYDFLARAYASHAVIGLRRQVKRGSESVSFVRLLDEMVDFPQTLTRTYFVDLYRDWPATRWANQDFDKFAGADNSHIDSALVAADRQTLLDGLRRCEDFADRRLAHRDLREPREPPTYNEVEDCIALLDRLYCRYHLLFHASSLSTLLPTWQYDWRSIFRVPWISGEDRNDR